MFRSSSYLLLRHVKRYTIRMRQSVQPRSNFIHSCDYYRKEKVS